MTETTRDKPEITRHFRDLDRGWAFVVMFACFVSLFVMGGTTYSVGIIHTVLLERFGESHGSTSWVGALNTALVNLAAPLSGFLVDTFSVRTAVVSGGALMSLGYFCSAFTPSLPLTVITGGIMSGLGGAIVWTASIIAPGFFFRKYRNIALGISISGTALGIFGIAPSMQKGKEEFGTSGIFIILTCITLQVIVCGVAIKPSSLEIHTQKKRKQLLYELKEQNRFLSTMKRYFKISTNKPIACLSLSIFLYCTGTYTVFVYLPSVCVNQGVSQMQASFVLSILGMGSVFGRVMAGIITSCNNVDEIAVYCITMALTGIITVVFTIFSDTYAGQVIYASLFGLFFGGPYVAITPINIRFVGVSNMAIALGIELCLGGIGTIFGPVLAGHILDKTGSYAHSFIIAGALIILGAVLGLSTLVFSKCSSCRMEDQTHHTMEVDVDDHVTKSLVETDSKSCDA